MTLALDPALQLALRCTLALLLLAAVWHKLRDPDRFAAALAGYRLAPSRALPALAVLVIAGELAIGASLPIPQAEPASALAAALLLAGYAAAIGLNLARGRRAIDCGCGSRPRPLGAGLVVRNLVLIVLALAAALPATARALCALDAATVLGGAAALVLLHAAADGALANGARLRALWT